MTQDEWTTRFRAWQEGARAVSDRADRVSRMIMKRCRAEATAAGLSGAIAPIHIHNALVTLHYGKPWEGVDYARVRKARWLEEQSLKPYSLASRINERSFKRIMADCRW